MLLAGCRVAIRASLREIVVQDRRLAPTIHREQKDGMPVRLLFVQESPSSLEWSFLEPEKFEWRCAPWDGFEPRSLEAGTADVVVPVAAAAAPGRVLELFDWLRGNPVATPTLALLPADAHDSLLSAAAEAADDFCLWPGRPGELRGRLLRMVGETRDHRHERLSRELGLAHLVGEAPAFLRTLEQIPRLAASDGPVLIGGETGTGKELCARALHHLSPRRAFPFIPVDCGAYPDHLFENELFGHVRGAYTDAHGDQKGLAALAEGGTLFLDEVDALSPAAQAKLLRFLQERTYKPLGAERFARADVRVLAATNRDLERCVRERRFRPDLFFRLNVLPLHLAPLRARAGDVVLLARHFLATLSARGPRLSLSPAALRKLNRHDWPGNVRELWNVMQRAALLCDGPQVLPGHVQLARPAPDAGEPPSHARFSEARSLALEAFERRYVEEVLERHAGNVTRAAAEAGKERRAFGRLVKKHGLKA
jgi:DNA-binding NtrC family response regulator